MKREQYVLLLKEVKDYFNVESQDIKLADNGGTISFEINKAYNMGRFGYKAKDTFNISGYSDYTNYKSIKKHIYLDKTKEELIIKAIEKIEALKQELLDLKKCKIEQQNIETTKLEDLRKKYGCLEVKKEGFDKYRLIYIEYELIMQFGLCSEVEFKVNRSIEQVRTFLQGGLK